MTKTINNLRHSIISKLIFFVGLVLLMSISIWAYFNITFQQERLKSDLASGADRLTDTIKLGAHYAMMLNSRDDINQIINNIARQRDIQTIRIYNKEGEIKFSNLPDEVDLKTNIKAEACDICHRTDPPQVNLNLDQRTRIFDSDKGYRLLGIISPIYNEPGCSTGDCHFHPQEKKILGALDVVVSLQETDQLIRYFEKGVIALAVFVFLITGTVIFILSVKFVKQPITKLIQGTELISQGHYTNNISLEPNNELGQLALAINDMGRKIGEKQHELNRQKDEYRKLFETVPCYITVQDQNYRLIQYNRQFAEKFAPKPGDYCYCAYKGRTSKCEVCPVERTFADGRSHQSEETGLSKDGQTKSWLVKTSPIRNSEGDIVAVMEMNLDITQRKQLEEELEKSEKKYHAIFNNIPNPVFVLDEDDLSILDCNDSVYTVYGYTPTDIILTPFTDMFPEMDRQRLASELKSSAVLNQVKQLNKEGQPLYVNIRVSPSEYPGQKVLLVTTSDITKRLETEQQLIQASKMATLGEMATGVAHELNQPLSVIKTASNFFMRKVKKKEPIENEILFTISEEIDSHVDRASKIINHMREFGRKSDMDLVEVHINNVIKKTFEIFSQQLTVRGIEIVWNLGEALPPIMADPDRLEQVFINLLINARDAIIENWEANREGEKTIWLTSRAEGQQIVVEVCDSGAGIPAHIASKIFEPFFTTKEVGKGTGLGLSISYGIVKDFGGDIRALPHSGGGACFRLRFPIQKP